MKADLQAVLQAMLPGGSGFPAGDETDAADWLLDQPRFTSVIHALLAALPKEFASQSPEQRTQALKAVEADMPDTFDAATVAIYSAYYTRSEVLAVIEATRGYKARPPQPGGYALAAFDSSILAVPQSRKRLWRDPETEASI